RPRRSGRLARRRQYHAMGLRAAGRIEGAGVMIAAIAPRSSWPGLSRPSTPSLRDRRIEVVPIWIINDDLSDLPGTRPMFDVVFALDGVADVIKRLEVDQPLQAVSLREAIDESGAMFEDAANEVVCHANVEDTIGSIGQKINVTACHAEIVQDVDGRDKP